MYVLNKFLYLLNSLNKTLKKSWKIETNILEKSGKNQNQGNLSDQKCGNHEPKNMNTWIYFAVF